MSPSSPESFQFLKPSFSSSLLFFVPPFLHPFIPSFLHLSNPAPLSCPVLLPSFPASHLSCIPLILHPSCPAYQFSCVPLFIYSSFPHPSFPLFSFPASLLSYILLSCIPHFLYSPFMHPSSPESTQYYIPPVCTVFHLSCIPAVLYSSCLASLLS